MPDQSGEIKPMLTCNWSKVIFTLYQKNDLRVYDFVLQDFSLIFFLSQKGFTPLHEAARNGHVRIVEILLKSYDSPDPEGKVSERLFLCIMQLIAT